MLTPQEVSTHAFSKAVMGGYNMAMVDEFLDELTDDYTEERLRQGQRDLAQFIAASREICEKELKFLEQLPELPVEAAEPISQQEPEEAVQQIEEKVLAAFSEQSVEEEAAPAEAEEASPAAEDDYPEGDPFAADPVDEPTRRINLNDLKFGRNYSGGDD